jgi:hypothetical protein
MNRQERRRQKALSRKYGVGDVLTTDYGRVVYVDQTVIDRCFLCDGPAKSWPHEGAQAHGVVRVNGETFLSLCERCFNSNNNDRDNQLARKIMGSPDMVIHEGGKASTEHIREIAGALKERERSSKHERSN